MNCLTPVFTVQLQSVGQTSTKFTIANQGRLILFVDFQRSDSEAGQVHIQWRGKSFIVENKLLLCLRVILRTESDIGPSTFWDCLLLSSFLMQVQRDLINIYGTIPVPYKVQSTVTSSKFSEHRSPEWKDIKMWMHVNRIVFYNWMWPIDFLIKIGSS